MDTTSSSNSRPPKYDVFLSFNGEDKCKGFTKTLYHVLKSKGIDVFIDDGLPRAGKRIEAYSLLSAVKESMIAVVIFSNKYASSSRCLDELLKIVEYRQVVLPIFYKVDRFHVQKQLGMFGDEFATLKNTESNTKLKKWKDALAFVATTESGWDLANYRTEINIIKEVAAYILKKLDSASLCSKSPGLIGISTLVDEVQKLLNNESTNVQFLGIWGVGGVGKSTLVEVIYHQVSKQFDTCYFAANVKEESSNRLVTLRDKILSRILGVNFSEGARSKISNNAIQKFKKKKVLIVLDNVSTWNQVTTLVGFETRFWCDPGSKVIITSRDCGIFKYEDMAVFEVKGLSPEHSLRLFCLNAFKQNQPPKNYLELSQQMVDYIKGVPLALKVLGSLLYKQKINKWISTLRKLKGSLDMQIDEVLKISYDDLDQNEKMIFLNIAYFFEGDDKDRVKNILENCGFNVTIGVSRLIKKCLLTLTADNKLGIHNLLQEMGRKIAKQQSSSEFGVHNRYWTLTNDYNVLTNLSEARAIEGIFLDMDKVKELHIDSKAFSRMENLRFFKVKQNLSFDGFHKSNINISGGGGVEFFPNNLRFLHWDRYSCKYLPSNFSAENVVELNLRNSKLKQLWNRAKHSINLKSLKVLDLQGSGCLTKLPDLSSAINLEKIILNECVSLLEIPISIQQLQNLSHLSLRTCINLQYIPSLINLKNLKTLDLYRCESLIKFPEVSEDIEVLNSEETTVIYLPLSWSCLNHLKAFHVTSSLESLPRTMHLNSLHTLSLYGCFRLKEFPKVVGNIQSLNLKGTGIRELPSSIVLLHSLVELNLQWCEKLERLPDNFGQVKSLQKLNLSYCSRLFDRHFTISGLCSIKELDMQSCGLREIPAWISTLSSLVVLNLSNNGFISIPTSIKQLSLLEVLYLKDCRDLLSLPELP